MIKEIVPKKLQICMKCKRQTLKVSVVLRLVHLILPCRVGEKCGDSYMVTPSTHFTLVQIQIHDKRGGITLSNSGMLIVHRAISNLV